MKEKRGEIPANSLTRGVTSADYSDVFRCGIPAGRRPSPDDILADFFTVMPAWVEALFKLRNAIVKPFGLKGGRLDAEAFCKALREGGSSGIMSVVAKNPDETVIKLSDSHLDAWLSVMYDGGWIYCTTLVKYHRWLGRAYFFFIGPFHSIIVPSMLKRTVARLALQTDKTEI